MVTNILPLSNIINVSITNTPSGLAARNPNAVALFTSETPDNLDVYREYISPAQVIEDYGSNSVTAEMANNIFAQSPNLRSGSGYLVIIPMLLAVSATAGTMTTANLSTTLAAIIATDDGDIRVTINGVNNDLTGLDFTNCEDFADIALVLQNRLTDVVVEAVSNGFKMTSKKVGTASTVEIVALPGGTGTDLAGVAYFKASTSVEVVGTNSTGESLEEAIERTETVVFYAGVITNLDLEDAAISSAAAVVQARDLIYLQHVASTQDIMGIAKTVKDAGQTKTRILTYTRLNMEGANLEKAAYTGRAFSVNFSGTNTAQTMNLKQLANVLPDNGINQTLYNQASVQGTDLYISYGVPSVFSTGGNDFFDNVYMNLALKFQLEEAGFNFLRQTNTKIPQTEAGMNGLKNAYSQVCQRFITNGFIAPGTWNSSETFGNPETFRQNVANRGYYIYSLPIADQDPIEREAREAPLVQIAIKRAGAIHTSDVLVIIND